MPGTPYSIAAAASLAAVLAGGSAPAQDIATRPTLNFYGVTGLMDMPTGEAQPDGQLSATVSRFAGITRGTLTFQVFPWLSGSFRYAGYEDWNASGFETFYDRSFDVQVRLLQERRFLPSLTLGLQDFAGTGISAAEYIVATKHVTPRVKVTAGLGWGRFGTQGTIGSPFGDRPGGFSGRGGQFEVDEWFRGPVAAFGGVEWQPTDRLGLKVEYSSDAYDVERGISGLRAGNAPLFERSSSWNFGAEYQVNDSLRLGGYYMYGSELGVTLQYSIDPRVRPSGAPDAGPGPLPVQPRPDRASDPQAWSTAWVQTTGTPERLRDSLAEVLATDGLRLEGLTLAADRAEVWVHNGRFDAEAQAVGRVARAMTRTMPASVERFDIVFVERDMPLSTVTLARSDVESLEHAPGGDLRLRDRVRFTDAGALDRPALGPADGRTRFFWGITPYLRQSFFDPDEPLRLETGVRVRGELSFGNGLLLSGSIAQPIAGNLDDSVRFGNSRLPAVRTDKVRFDREGDPAIETLTGAWYARPGPDLYSRVTVGYLERMFGGVSGEVLWQPVDSPLAIGAEVNYVKQRDFDQLFGFQSYDVVTGHVSAYYEFLEGYHAQVDVGRYLAGDYGATFTVSREFENGWKLAGFATFTDVSAEDFGEGSFDKGIKVEIPLSWVTGRPSRNSVGTTLRPVLRDGGARLNVQGRLFETVRDYDQNGIDGRWGRVWR